jgi:hypothetical protein
MTTYSNSFILLDYFSYDLRGSVPLNKSYFQIGLEGGESCVAAAMTALTAWKGVTGWFNQIKAQLPFYRVLHKKWIATLSIDSNRGSKLNLLPPKKYGVETEAKLNHLLSQVKKGL